MFFICFKWSIHLNTSYFMIGDPIELKYILSYLNSKIGKFIVNNYTTPLQKRQYRLFQQSVEEFPIPPIQIEEKRRLSKIVDKIIENKTQLKETNFLENEINNIIYSILNLNKEEIAFIESR